MDDPVKAFHAHLDVCKWCDEHCFELCPEGQKLLKAAAEDPRIVKIMGGRLAPTLSGRFSSEPHYQNMPVTSPLAEEIINAFRRR